MKLLLDENLPHQLRHEIVGHDVFTVAYMGWAGVQNGELLGKAAADGFDALLTTDWGLEYEQNLATLPLAVVLLRVKPNTIEALRPLIPELQQVLSQLKPMQLAKIPAN